MTGTNRTLNRTVLLLVGLAGLLGGAAIVGIWTMPAWASTRDGLVAGVASTVDRLGRWRLDLADAGLGSVPAVLLIVPAAALLLAALVIAFVASQGRGRTQRVLRIPLKRGPAAGILDVDVSVASATIGEPLAGRRDVVGVHVSAYRVRRQPVILAAVSPRRGADITAILEHAATAVADWQALLGRRVPVVVHLTRGSWSSLRREARVE